MGQRTIPLGREGVLYYTTSARTSWSAAASEGVYIGAAPSLTPINVVSDVTLNVSDTEADASNRSSAWKLIVQGLTDGSVDVKIPWNPTDAGFQALRKAKFTKTPIAIAVLDGDAATTGSQGLWADMAVTQFTRAEPLDGAMAATVKLVPSPSQVAPQWVEVG